MANSSLNYFVKPVLRTQTINATYQVLMMQKATNPNQYIPKQQIVFLACSDWLLWIVFSIHFPASS